MKTRSLPIIALAAALVLGAASAHAQVVSPRQAEYDVTVTNLSRGQILSPPIVIVRDPGFALYKLGQPAPVEISALAEDADAGALIGALESAMRSGEVADWAMAETPLPPGESVTLRVRSSSEGQVISSLAMLVTTNDAFMAASSEPLAGARTLRRERQSYFATAYDAGSEANSESCESIPGPPCGRPFVRDTAGAEGFVHVHAGIHGAGDLAPSQFDWRNPVAFIEVQQR